MSLLLPAAAAAQVPPAPPAPPMPVAPVAAPAPAPMPAPVAPPAIAARPAPRAFAIEPDVNLNLDLRLDELKQSLPDLQIQLDDVQANMPELQMQIEALKAGMPALLAQAGDARTQAEVQRRMQENAQRMAERAREMAEQQRGRMAFAFAQDGGGAYRAGLDALQRRQYDDAVKAFDRVIAQKAPRADAALYWKAFGQFKLARTDDALAAITQLRRDYAQSRYLADAKVLEADVRKAAGQPVNPTAADDEEIKLLAIQGLSKSEQAVPLLEGVLNATNSLNVKRRALYVLALSDDARAHQVLMRYAKGGGNPDLQVEAIRYLASRKDSKTTPAELREIFDSTDDVNVKMAVIDAYRTWGDKGALLQIIRQPNVVVDVRRSAISRLNGLADAGDVMAIYQSETDPALRTQLVGTLGSMEAVDQLVSIAKTDKDPTIRARAVRAIGNRRNDKTTQALVGLYGSEQNKDVRRAVIQTLGGQNDAETLIALAKKETDVELKRELVRRISDMAPNSKPATDFLMDQLK
jgi:HEAT repeat protein